MIMCLCLHLPYLYFNIWFGCLYFNYLEYKFRMIIIILILIIIIIKLVNVCPVGLVQIFFFVSVSVSSTCCFIQNSIIKGGIH